MTNAKEKTKTAIMRSKTNKKYSNLAHNIMEEPPSIIVFVLGGVCMLIVLVLSFMGKR